MSSWREHDLGEETCPKCKSIYKVKYKDLPLKDQDNFTCSCGHEMRSWNETGMYMYTLVKKGPGVRE